MTGIAASDGYAIGPAFFLKRDETVYEKESNLSVEKELARLNRAVDLTTEDLNAAYMQALERTGAEHAEIFQMHIALLLDEEFLGKARELIQSGGTAEYAVKVSGGALSGEFAALGDPYMQARAADFEDITVNLVNRLTGTEDETLPEKPVVLVSDDLTPNQLLRFSGENLLGIVTRKGSVMSHASILARNLGIPAVVAVGKLPPNNEGTVIVDGSNGMVFFDPTEEQLVEYRQRMACQAEEKERREVYCERPGMTADGHHVEIACNIGEPEDVKSVLSQGGESIGLFRSEFLFIGRVSAPTEEEQTSAYSTVLKKMEGRRVIVRTLDIGADKYVPYFEGASEENPALGCRAIRFSLTHPEVFRIQLRALLRASVHGDLAIMFPMIVSETEVIRAEAVLDEVKEELRQEKIPFSENIEVGIMVETPAAALITDRLAQLVDFFSIGTNDLTQYTLAADRGNAEVNEIYDFAHPAVMSLIRMTIESAHAHGIWAGICGESAADERLLKAYVGMGVDELSVSPMKVLKLKENLSKLHLDDCYAAVIK